MVHRVFCVGGNALRLTAILAFGVLAGRAEVESSTDESKTTTTVTLPAPMQASDLAPTTVSLIPTGSCFVTFALLGSESLYGLRFIVAYDLSSGGFGRQKGGADCTFLSAFGATHVEDEGGILRIITGTDSEMKSFDGPLDVAECTFEFAGQQPSPDDFLLQVQAAPSAFSAVDADSLMARQLPDVIVSSLDCAKY